MRLPWREELETTLELRAARSAVVAVLLRMRSRMEMNLSSV